jgi:hypothetical protein
MADRAELLMKLVLERHVNVVERQRLGVVCRQEIVGIVKSLVLQRGVFPDRRGSRAVFEGATLAKVPDGAEIAWERSYPWDPFTVAERRSKVFEDLGSL